MLKAIKRSHIRVEKIAPFHEYNGINTKFKITLIAVEITTTLKRWFCIFSAVRASPPKYWNILITGKNDNSRIAVTEEAYLSPKIKGTTGAKNSILIEIINPNGKATIDNLNA